LLSFVLAALIAQVYAWTHRGISYSRAYVQTLVLGSVVSATLMLAIGNNLARGLGILGTLAIIRFRSLLKDPRDMVFVFAALSAGTAVGMRSHVVATLGTAAFCAVAWLMHVAEFGARNRFDGLLRVQLPNDPPMDGALRAVLKTHCQNAVLVALREIEQGRKAEYAYHVKLVNPEYQSELVRDVSALEGARAVAFYLQDAAEEV
jgi:hypothetical protein